ncbi:MAG TPA: PQQ-binding-like beta-propeller repeat protein [Acidimicrobiales bacterium]|jgi:outer membrane protein assembly factor BamB|nr:PQQ-binding-like beta-propeller repeat protein [Acidimicrobiales bacterium]
MWRDNARRRAVVALVATMCASILTVVSFAISSGAPASASSASSWTVYHGDVAGSGVSTSLRSVDTSKRAWTSPTLNGQIFGEPLVYAGRVYVATESDMIYALSTANGSVAWSRHVGSAVPSSRLPCGDISPSVGITGTPVIDPSRNEIFVVAAEIVNGSPVHELVGLSTTSGALEIHEHVDPRGADPSALLERSALSLDVGRVVFAFGGNYGDCGSYRGRVVSVRETGSTPSFFTVDANSGDSQGAVWMGGAAPIVDARGNVWVSAGNGSVHSSGQPYDDSDSVLELSASLRLKQYFAPSSWADDNASDRDMSTAPALLSDGQVVAAGKSPTVYLLNGSRLGGIGKEEASVSGVCGNDIDGGSAVVGMTVYLPCLNGPVALRVTSSPPALTVLWQASVGGGPAIVAAGMVWTIGQDGVLYGLDASTGHVRQQASIGAPANHFPTPSVGSGLLLAASATRVVAFHAAVVS